MAEEVVASSYLSNEKKYLSKYVEMNYDSVNNRFDSLYSKLNYCNKTKLGLSRKMQYRFYAIASRTDHLLDMEINMIYDTIKSAEESDRIWDHLWENNNSLTKELVGANYAHFSKETYKLRKIKYKLRYIDGHSGRTLWRMKCRWPAMFFSSKKQNPVLLIKKKFDKKFPYKLVEG